jgi:two-component system, OmpR family, response regulator
MRKILLADDEPDIRRIAEIALRGLGEVEVLNASSGIEAFALARQHHPDLVLLDVMMPGLDGVETLERLKTDPETVLVPVVIMTARASRADQARYLARGAADVVVKPFDPSKLVARVEKVLAAATTAEELDRRLAVELAALRDEFVQRLPAQLDYLERMVGALASPPLAEQLDHLAGDVHRLRGTAGSHGLLAFAAALEELEAELVGGAADQARVVEKLAAVRRVRDQVSSPR